MQVNSVAILAIHVTRLAIASYMTIESAACPWISIPFEQCIGYAAGHACLNPSVTRGVL